MFCQKMQHGHQFNKQQRVTDCPTKSAAANADANLATAAAAKQQIPSDKTLNGENVRQHSKDSKDQVLLPAVHLHMKELWQMNEQSKRKRQSKLTQYEQRHRRLAPLADAIVREAVKAGARIGETGIEHHQGALQWNTSTKV